MTAKNSNIAGLDERTAPPCSPLLLTVAAALSLTGVGRTTLYRLITEGELSAVKVGRRTLLPYAELQRWASGLPFVPPRGPGNATRPDGEPGRSDPELAELRHGIGSSTVPPLRYRGRRRT